VSNKISKLTLSVGLCLGAGILGSFFTTSSIQIWYATLIKPPFSPPNWIFGPVWTTLYVLMGISLYLVWISKSRLKQKAIYIFLLQLVLNALWSVVFFGLHNPALALIEIVSLWISISITILVFQKISKPASYLLYPYLVWVSIASILNYSIWILNK